MTEMLGTLLLSMLAGLILGAIYFGGLWFSLSRLLPLKHASAWLMLSFLIRNLIVLFGFYWTMDGRWERLVVAFLGFTLVRVFLSRHAAQKLPSGT